MTVYRDCQTCEDFQKEIEYLKIAISTKNELLSEYQVLIKKQEEKFAVASKKQFALTFANVSILLLGMFLIGGICSSLFGYYSAPEEKPPEPKCQEWVRVLASGDYSYQCLQGKISTEKLNTSDSDPKVLVHCTCSTDFKP